jgi:hypothetical protein
MPMLAPSIDETNPADHRSWARGAGSVELAAPLAVGLGQSCCCSYGSVQPAGAGAGISSGSGSGGALKKVATTTVSFGPANAEWI